jgi:di/tricarboxylate transporter
VEALIVALGLVAMGAVNLAGLVPVEVAGLALLLVLVGVGVIPADGALSGFGSEAVWLVTGMMMVGETIRLSGLVGGAADALTAAVRGSRRRLTMGLTVLGAVTGALLESTAAVTALLPVATTTARRVHAAPGRAYASLALGGMAGGLLTLIGTSGNIVANALLRKLTGVSLGFFTLLPLGLGFLAIGLVYAAWTTRAARGEEGAGHLVDLRHYVGEVQVPADSPWVGQALADIRVFRERDITVLRIFRGRSAFDAGPAVRVRAGDRLLVGAPAEDHLRWQDVPGLEAVGERRVQEDRERLLRQARELMLPPGSPWVGRTAEDLRLRQQHVELVAIWRQGSTLSHRIANQRLSVGDMLLVLAPADRLAELERNQTVVTVTERDAMVWPAPGRLWALLPLGVFLGLVLAAGVGLGVAALTGAVLALIIGRYPPQQIYRSVEWRVPLFIGAMLPVAGAVARTGLAARMAAEVVTVAGPHLGWVVMLVYIMAAGLTQILSNIATAAVMTPVAVDIAARLGVHPTGMVVAVLAALMMTPLTGTANKPALLIMARGALKHRDYLRWGLMPSLGGAVVAWVMVMALWWPGRFLHA